MLSGRFFYAINKLKINILRDKRFIIHHLITNLAHCFFLK
jgi:hypothetical protein